MQHSSATGVLAGTQSASSRWWQHPRLQMARRFVVWTLVATASILLTAWVLSLWRVPSAVTPGTRVPFFAIDGLDALDIVQLLITGALFVLARVFLRPILVMLFGQLAVRTLGLFMFVFDVILFVLVVLFSPIDFSIANNLFPNIVLVVAVFTLCEFVLRSIVGARRPRVDADDPQTFVWRLLDRLPATNRNVFAENLRFQRLNDMLWDFGVDDVLSRTPLVYTRSLTQRFVYGGVDDIASMNTPQRLRVMLSQLGPTYVKLGQMMAGQTGRLPEEWITELSKLQNNVPPFPYEQAAAVIKHELGAPPEDIFATFEREPMAAASTAQVHRATTKTGDKVVVKVQRPNIVPQVNADLGVMRQFSALFEARIPMLRAIGLHGMVDEFGNGVARELDYRNEAYHAMRMADNMKTLDGVGVPTVYPEHSTSRVLTMEFVGGVKISKIRELEAAGVNKEDLAVRFVRALIKQVAIDGFFHADPHPGNIFADPATGKLTFLDLGLVGELDATQRMDLMDVLISLNRNDTMSMAQTALRLCTQTRPVDFTLFHRDIERIVLQNWVYTGTSSTGAKGGSFSKIISQLLATFTHYGLRMDKNLTLAMKAMGQVEETAKLLSPDSRFFIDTAYTQAQELVKEQFSSEKVKEAVTNQAYRLVKDVVRNASSFGVGGNKWLETLKRGRLIHEVDFSALDAQLDKLDATVRRLTVGVTLAGMSIGLAILGSQAAGLLKEYNDALPIIVIGLLVLVLAGSVALVVAMLRRNS